MNQTASVQVCLIPDVVTTVDIPGIGPTLVVLSTDGCPRGFVDTQITVGRFHLCADSVKHPDENLASLPNPYFFNLRYLLVQ